MASLSYPKMPMLSGKVRCCLLLGPGTLNRTVKGAKVASCQNELVAVFREQVALQLQLLACKVVFRTGGNKGLGRAANGQVGRLLFSCF